MGKPVQMQRRHYCLIADAIRTLDGLDRMSQERVANHFAKVLRRTNDGFNETRFLEAAECAGPFADAYSAGRDNGHGLACHNVPKVGETYWTDADGRVRVDLDNAKEVHETLCYEAEANARCYSPWEFTARDLNDLPEEQRDRAWELYDEGVQDAIGDDLRRYDLRDYLPADMEEKLECMVEAAGKQIA